MPPTYIKCLLKLSELTDSGKLQWTARNEYNNVTNTFNVFFEVFLGETTPVRIYMGQHNFRIDNSANLFSTNVDDILSLYSKVYQNYYSLESNSVNLVDRSIELLTAMETEAAADDSNPQV